VVATTLLDRGPVSEVPPAAIEGLRHRADDAVAHNEARMPRFAELLRRFRREGIDPILLKSVALYALLYPRLRGHQMVDVDLLVEARERPRAERLLQALGFRAILDGGDAVAYIDGGGSLVVDLHSRFRLFEGHDPRGLVRRVESAAPGFGPIRIFEAEPFLVHMAFHLFDHQRSGGLCLSRVIDLGLILRHCCGHLDDDAVRRLVPDRRTLGWVLRSLEFYRREFGIDATDPRDQPASRITRLTVAEICRDRRRGIWRLDHLGGWRHLVACAVGLRTRGRKPYPGAGDLLLWPADLFRCRWSELRTPPIGRDDRARPVCVQPRIEGGITLEL
jgi:Uncharacterised nucleotidyltransferase